MNQLKGTSYRAELVMAIVMMAALMLVVLSIAEALAQGQRVEPRGASDSDPPWVAPLRAADEAVAAGDLSRAVSALNQAHLSALACRKWEGLIAVGDAALRIGGASNGRPKARQAYLAALLRARTETSLEGVLMATEAFAALGDREVVAQGLRVARALIVRTGDARALARIATIEERLGELTLTAGDFRMME